MGFNSGFKGLMYDETKPSYKFLNSCHYVIFYFCIPLYTSGANKKNTALL